MSFITLNCFVCLKAGINSALLSIALEPEAASLYCQHQHVEQDESEDDQAQQSTVRFRPPKAGTKYAVVDLGGMDKLLDVAIYLYI